MLGALRLRGRNISLERIVEDPYALALVGIIFLALFYWLLPSRTRETASLHEAIDIKNYVSEARVASDSSMLGKTVADLLKLSDGNAMVTSIIRSRGQRVTPLPDAILKAGDILLLEGDPEALDKLTTRGRLRLSLRAPRAADR